LLLLAYYAEAAQHKIQK